MDVEFRHALVFMQCRYEICVRIVKITAGLFGAFLAFMALLPAACAAEGNYSAPKRC